jgi:xylono-1,5-lactonase
VAVPKRRGVGGIAIHRDGGIVVGGRNVCHVAPDGTNRVLYQPDTGLNDLFPDAAGRVVFGTLRSDPFAEGQRRPGEAWLVTAVGEATELYGDVGLTNGIGLSPDGATLYHSDTAVNGVWAHDYDAGRVANRRFLCQLDDLQPDGLAVDEQGVVWVADVSGSRSVRGFAPDGSEAARIAVPSRMVTSVCFGGPDRRDMYIVTADNTEDHARGGTVFHTRAEVPGVAVAEVTI